MLQVRLVSRYPDIVCSHRYPDIKSVKRLSVIISLAVVFLSHCALAHATITSATHAFFLFVTHNLCSVPAKWHCNFGHVNRSYLLTYTHGVNTGHATLMKSDILIDTGFSHAISRCRQSSILTTIRQILITGSVLLDQCRSTKIDLHRFSLQWTGCGSESVARWSVLTVVFPVECHASAVYVMAICLCLSLTCWYSNNKT